MHLEMPLVGRDTDVDALHASLSQGSGAILTGDPGVGTSRLVEAVADQVAESGRHVVALRASATLQRIPFGLFAQLPRELLTHHSVVSEDGIYLDAAAQEFTRWLGPEPLIVIDDVEYLDASSASLIQYLVRSGTAQILGTADERATLPFPIEHMLRSGDLDHIEILPLSPGDLIDLAESTLGGPIDAPTRRRLNAMAEGNPLFLRELLIAGMTSGSLRQHHGLWSWCGEMAAGERLAILFNNRFAVDPPTKEVLQLVALAQPFDLALLEQLAPAPAIDAAVGRGLVAVEPDGRRCRVSLAHPIYTEPIRSMIGPSLKRRLAQRLYDALRTTAGSRQDDELQMAELLLDSGQWRDSQQLDRAATKARSLGQIRLAERFGRAAVAEGAGAGALNRLAETLIWTSKFDDIIELIADAEFDENEGDERSILELHRSTALFFGSGTLDEALDSVHTAQKLADTDAIRDLGLAHEAELLAFAGRTVAAEELGRVVLGSPAAEPRSLASAYGAIVPSLAMRGLVVEARALADEAYAALFAEPNPPIWEMAGVVAGQFMASLIDPQEERNDQFAPSDSAEFDPLAGIWLCLHGRELFARGDMTEAIRVLKNGTELLGEDDPGRFLPWATAMLGAAYGAAGDVQSSGRSILELNRFTLPQGSVFTADLALGRAWSIHGRGDLIEARALILSTVDELAEHGSFGTAAALLFEAIRLGTSPGSIENRARSLPRLDCFVVDLVKQLGRHHHDEACLEALAHSCADRHRPLWAAELASMALAATSDPGRADHYRQLALSWLTVCNGAQTPLLETLRTNANGVHLTPREADVARLVAAGLSNPAVAEKLFVSRRTVESHLGRIYTKLGINSRDELSQRLGP